MITREKSKIKKKLLLLNKINKLYNIHKNNGKTMKKKLNKADINIIKDQKTKKKQILND